MYRYTVDNAVTYTSEDFVLFRESPFACWMERLTLENPDHGIPPDVGSAEPQNSVERQDDIVETLRAEGRDVVLIDWELDESRRRTQTLEAMRGGADFIVNGQLALGPLSGSANLLMRTSGYSELGDFLYIPCDTQAKTTLHSAFRLCFLADLLHSLQGQLPPQMLIIRGGLDVVPLQCEDHIYYYRAVKQRFMDTMRNFRKHRMPDPAESSHFGRWSECANEVLKQRALKEDQQDDPVRAEEFEIPLLQAAAGAGPGAPPYGLHDIDHPSSASGGVGPETVMPGQAHFAHSGAGQTLAEQARMLTADSYAPGARGVPPGPTPNLAWSRQVGTTAVQAAAGEPGHNRRSSDVALQNLEFIGSSDRAPLIGVVTTGQVEEAVTVSDAPEPALRESASVEYRFPEQGEKLISDPPGVALGEPGLEQAPTDVEVAVAVEAPAIPAKPHPLDSVGFNLGARPVAEMPAIDLDAAPAPTLKPSLAPADSGFELDELNTLDESVLIEKGDFEGAPDEAYVAARLRIFSDSLITSDDYSD